MPTPALTLTSLTTMTNALFDLARDHYSNLPTGPVPVFAITSPEDRKQVGIGFDLGELQAMPLDDALLRVFIKVASIITFYRLGRGEVSKLDVMDTCFALQGQDPAGYAAWVAAQMQEARGATRH